MIKVFKYRLYPSKEQRIQLAQNFGCCRYIYNKALEYKELQYTKHGKNVSEYDLNSSILKEEKKKNDWLKSASAQSLQASINDLCRGYENFFQGRTKHPTFRKKKNRQSCRYPQHVVVCFNRIKIPKLGWTKCKLHRKFTGLVKNATVIKEPSNRYYVSVCVDVGEQKTVPKKRPNKKTTVGIDLGIKDFATTSNGEKIKNPKYLDRLRNKLAVEQRKLSRKKTGSIRYERQRIRVARVYEKISNQRRDFLHKVSYKLTHDKQVNTICIEDLNVKDMVRKRFLSRNISDAGGGMFRQFLRYKCDWYGVNLVEIDRFDPSSKQCSKCGRINEKLTLNQRSWHCDACGSTHDRDINASINIRNFGLEHAKRSQAGKDLVAGRAKRRRKTTVRRAMDASGPSDETNKYQN